MYITVDDIKNEVSLYYPIDNKNGNKKVSLIRAYFIYSCYNVEKDEEIPLKNGSPLLVKRGCYTMKDIEKVFSGKVMSQSIPTGHIPPPGNPGENFFEQANPGHPGKFFCLIPCPGAKNDGRIPRGWGKIFPNSKKLLRIKLAKVL